MRLPSSDLFTPREIALAAGVPEEQVLAALREETARSSGSIPASSPSQRPLVARDAAVRIGRALVRRARSMVVAPSPLFSTTVRGDSRGIGVPLALSSSMHIAAAIAVFIATFRIAPPVVAFKADARSGDRARLVFLTTLGPGGGGGGGGLVQPTPAPQALREGTRPISSPLPQRWEPPRIDPRPKPAESKAAPPLEAEPLPAVVAPIVTAPADAWTRAGVLEQSKTDSDSRGPGPGGGAGTGNGVGLGAGSGSGVGPGTGGGAGGGPFRPGSGIDPPRLLREVKADFTEDARQRAISGDVVLEIVVRRDGTVGDIRVLQGLGGGLNERAVEAVRQWRFSPARRSGEAVDVFVEVAVAFNQR
jgi:protein TonB